MTRALALVALVACGAARAPKPSREHYRFERIIAGRTAAFSLDLERGRAELLEATTRYAGTRRDASDGSFDLDLAAPGVQPLQLHCVRRIAHVAAAGAELACGAWTPPDREDVQVIDCGASGEPPDDDDDDRLVFAAGVGVERVVSRAACGRSSGLRRPTARR